MVYNISFKTLIGAKPLRIRFDKGDGFIRVYDGNRYVVLFGPEIYGAIYNRLRYLISQKMLCLKCAVLGQKTFITNKSTFKMTKNAFYFTLKTRFDLEIFKLLSWLFGHVEKPLEKKDKINFKSYDVTIWTQIIAKHILVNISRSKDNKTKKFGQLIEYNITNIFLEKLYTKCGAEIILRPFFGIWN